MQSGILVMVYQYYTLILYFNFISYEIFRGLHDTHSKYFFLLILAAYHWFPLHILENLEYFLKSIARWFIFYFSSIKKIFIAIFYYYLVFKNLFYCHNSLFVMPCRFLGLMSRFGINFCQVSSYVAVIFSGF